MGERHGEDFQRDEVLKVSPHFADCLLVIYNNKNKKLLYFLKTFLLSIKYYYSKIVKGLVECLLLCNKYK